MRLGDRVIHGGELCIVADIRGRYVDVRRVHEGGRMSSPVAVLAADLAPLVGPAPAEDLQESTDPRE